MTVAILTLCVVLCMACSVVAVVCLAPLCAHASRASYFCKSGHRHLEREEQERVKSWGFTMLAFAFIALAFALPVLVYIHYS